jgi:hypothetical protein
MQYLKMKLIAATLVAGVCLPAIADDDRDRRGMPKLDTDGDGLISQDEFRFPGTRMLENADSDGDGMVTAEEMSQASAERHERMQAEMAERLAHMQEESEARFTAMDTDGDGAVTTEEAEAHAFSTIDTDDDGYISRKEMRQKRGGFDRGRAGPPRGDKRHHPRGPRQHQEGS